MNDLAGALHPAPHHREALIEALETSPAEELSVLKAIGKQFETSQETVARLPPPEREVILDDATRERRGETERFLAGSGTNAPAIEARASAGCAALPRSPCWSLTPRGCGLLRRALA